MLDSSDSLSVGNHRIGLLQGNTGVVLLQILEADLKVKLTNSSDDVLSRLLNHALHHGIGLGQTLQTFDQLGQISRILGLDSNPDNRGDRELHLLHVVGLLKGGDGTSLDEELINTDQATDVASRHILNGFDTAAHHENGPLDGLLVQVGLLSGDKVGSHNPCLLSSGHLTREDTSKGVESALVRCRHHLGHAHHKWSIGVTVLDAHAGGVIVRSLVEKLSPVLLGSDGGGKVDDDHLENSVTSRQPVPHHTLHQGLAFQLLLLGLQHVLHQLTVGCGQLAQQLLGLLLLEVHDGVEDHVDGVEDVHAEGAFVVVGLLLAPLLCLGVEEGLTPDLLHHLVSVDTELVGVHLSKLLQGESPSVQS